MDFVPIHVVQYVHKTQIPNGVDAFDEKLPEERPNLDVSSSKYSYIVLLIR